MNSKHQTIPDVYISNGTGTNDNGQLRYLCNAHETNRTKFRKYSVEESEDEATAVLGMRWRSQHYAKGKMSVLAEKGNGHVHW